MFNQVHAWEIQIFFFSQNSFLRYKNYFQYNLIRSEAIGTLIYLFTFLINIL